MTKFPSEVVFIREVWPSSAASLISEDIENDRFDFVVKQERCNFLCSSSEAAYTCDGFYCPQVKFQFSCLMKSGPYFSLVNLMICFLYDGDFL